MSSIKRMVIVSSPFSVGRGPRTGSVTTFHGHSGGIIHSTTSRFACPLPLLRKLSSAPATELHIGGAVQTPLVLTAADLKKMPRKTLAVSNPHTQKKETYEGVALEDLLKKVGVPNGDQMRGRWLRMSFSKQPTTIA